MAKVGERMTSVYVNSILEKVSSGVALYEYTGDKLTMTYCNKTVCAMLGYTVEKFMQKSAEDVFFCVYDEDIPKISECLKMCIISSMNNEKEIRFVRRDRSVLWMKCSSNLLDREGDIKRIVVTFTDITEEITSKEELSFRADHDELTSIFNANAFYLRTRELLSENPDEDFILVRINIVKFKVINDLFGTKAADNILISIARHIESALKDRTASYGRVTSDHFAFCMPADDFNEEKFVEQMKEFSDMFPDYYNLSFKAGIYRITDKAVSVSVMCDRAKLAMQTIKEDTGKVYAYYNDDIRKNLLLEQRIESEMQWALDNEQFEIWFQPIYSLSSMQPYSAEALVRWRHPTKGLISPGMFIPVFEKNGFIRKLDSYIFEHVCIYVRHCIDSGKHLLPISVNFSRMSLYTDDLADEVISIVEKYGLTPDLFKIEITETAYNNYPQQLLSTINKLRGYGFTILMDDFGSGYSSLNILKDLPIDVLKIDMNFMSDFNTSDKATNILASIIRMAKWLDMPCIAEGVETEMQVDFLRSIGCENIQGYYFSKPLVQSDFERLISNDNGAVHTQHDPDKSLEALSEDVDAMLSGNQTVARLMNGLFGGIGFYEFDGSKLEVIRVNDGYYRIFGYTLTQHAHDAKNIMDKVHKHDIPLLREALKQASETKKAVHLNFRRYNAKDELLWLDASVSRFGGNEEKQLMCIAFNDITEHILLEKKGNEKMHLLNHLAKRLLEITDIKTEVPAILGVVRKYYHAQRAAIFDLDANADGGNIFFENRSEEFIPDRRDVKTVPFQNFKPFLSLLRSHRVLSIKDVNELEDIDDATRTIFGEMGITSIIAVPIYTGEHMTGFICIDNPQKNIEQLDFLQSFSYYFSLVAVRHHVQDRSDSYNRQMNAIIENMNGGVGLFTVTDEGKARTVYVSENFLRIAQLDGSSQLDDITLLADPRDRDAFAEALAAAIKSGGKMTDQFRLCKAREDTGEDKWVSISCSVVSGKDGKRGEMIAVLNDITGQIAEEQGKYSSALASVFDRIYRIDLSGSRISLVSSENDDDSAFDWIMHIFDIAKEQSKNRKWLAKMCMQAYINNTYSCDYNVTVNGEEKWLSLTFLKLTDTDYLLCALDETDKKQAEEISIENEKLKLEQQFHDSESVYVNQSGVVIIEYDYAARKIVATDNFKRFRISAIIESIDLSNKGLTAEVTKDTIHPDDLRVAMEIFANSSDCPPKELRMKLVNGDYLWCSITKTVVRDKSGRPLRSGYTILDINERKLSEKRLKATSEMMSNIANSANSGVVLFEVGENGSIHTLYRNDAYYVVLGQDKDSYEKSGTIVADILSDPEKKKLVKTVITDAANGNIFTKVVSVTCTDGCKKWVKLSFAPYRSGDGKDNERKSILIIDEAEDPSK